MHVFGPAAILVLAFCAAAALAQDTPEPGSAEEIAKATTAPQFLSPWVASLPASASVPSPRAFLKRIPGAPGELVDSATAYGYARALADASPRVELFTIGRSEEGRDIVLLAIADEAGIQALEQLKKDTAALADPRTTDAAAAEQIVARARPIYYFNAALHADETGSTESVLELAYRLAVSEQPMLQRIRQNLVVLINPVSNPDGRDKVVEWFYRFLKGKTDRNTLPRMSPPYWSKYAFVDINRDAHQLVHESTRAVSRMFFDWHPTVVHDLHESVALLMSWNGTGPYNPNIDPITFTEFQALSFHEVQTLTSFGLPGVSHSNSSEWDRVQPPPSTPFLWSARDNVNYNETAALAALDLAATQSKLLLRSFYRKSLNSWRKGVDEPPYAFAIPQDQGDPRRVAQLIARLQSQHIEVHRSNAAFNVKEGTFGVGTYLVRLDQPYRNYAVDLLAPQEFPQNGGEPYDDVSWQLPAHYHVEAIAIADPAIKSVGAVAVTEAPQPHGKIAGDGPTFVLKDTGQEGLLEARYRLAKFKIEIAELPFKIGEAEYPAGSWLVPAQSGLNATLQDLTARLALDFDSVAAAPDVARHAAKAPRLGVWVPWADTDSIGWLRHTLDERNIPYAYVRDEDVRAGNLRAKYDVLLYGHVDLELAEQIHGLPKAWGPMPFKKTKQTPSHGTPAASDDITGGVGWEGLAQLQKFIESGGVLVTLGSGTMLALEGGIVRGVRRDSGGTPRSAGSGGAESAQAAVESVTRTPGSHVRVSFAQPDHPIAYGYPAHTYVFRQNYPLYAVPRRWLRMAFCTTCLDGPSDPGSVVMQWGDTGTDRPFLVSGQVWGESNLIGRPAILDMQVGRGRVVSFNFNPLHRDLNRGDQRLLWNAILNWEAILARRAEHDPL